MGKNDLIKNDGIVKGVRLSGAQPPSESRLITSIVYPSSESRRLRSCNSSSISETKSEVIGANFQPFDTGKAIGRVLDMLGQDFLEHLVHGEKLAAYNKAGSPGEFETLAFQ